MAEPENLSETPKEKGQLNLSFSLGEGITTALLLIDRVEQRIIIQQDMLNKILTKLDPEHNPTDYKINPEGDYMLETFKKLFKLAWRVDEYWPRAAKRWRR